MILKVIFAVLDVLLPVGEVRAQPAVSAGADPRKGVLG